MHHAVQGAAGIRRFDIKAGPFDAVLGEVTEQADAVDGESICSDKASASYRSVTAALVAHDGIAELAAFEVDADLLLRLRPVGDLRDGPGDGRGEAGEVWGFVACGRSRRRGIGHQGGGRGGNHADHDCIKESATFRLSSRLSPEE